MGGAFARAPEGAGALDRIAAPWLLEAVGPAVDAAQAAVSHERLGRVIADLAPWAAGQYLNFSERPGDAASAFGAGTWERLLAVRRRVDPDGLMRAHQPIAAAVA